MENSEENRHVDTGSAQGLGTLKVGSSVELGQLMDTQF